MPAAAPPTAILRTAVTPAGCAGEDLSDSTSATARVNGRSNAGRAPCAILDVLSGCAERRTSSVARFGRHLALSAVSPSLPLPGVGPSRERRERSLYGDRNRAGAASRQSPLRRAISNAIVKCVREYTGRGPMKARTTIRDNVVLVMLEETLTKGEQVLLKKGRSEQVLALRHEYQEAMREESSDRDRRADRTPGDRDDERQSSRSRPRRRDLRPRRPAGHRCGAPRGVRSGLSGHPASRGSATASRSRAGPVRQERPRTPSVPAARCPGRRAARPARAGGGRRAPRSARRRRGRAAPRGSRRGR